MENKSKSKQHVKLKSLGWRPFFNKQVNDSEWGEFTPVRVVAEHRTAVIVHDGFDEHRIKLDRQLNNTLHQRKPTTGDWLLVDLSSEQIWRALNPENMMTRISAGVSSGQKIQEQAIAVNIDILFIVTSANNEFSESRLERYLALAKKTAVRPVIVITKSDLVEDAQSYRKRALAITDTPTVLVNAKEKYSVRELRRWLNIGDTIAVLGSSGVGKSTIVNTLAGTNIQETGIVRTTDNRGRHTTTSRSIHLLKDGPMILDTPGIRELTLAHSKEVLSEMFADIEALLLLCRFTNCTHELEPDCAIRDALAKKVLDRRRFNNYQKLCAEHSFYTEAINGSDKEKYDSKIKKTTRGKQQK